jgi:hypothetical protein
LDSEVIDQMNAPHGMQEWIFQNDWISRTKETKEKLNKDWQETPVVFSLIERFVVFISHFWYFAVV